VLQDKDKSIISFKQNFLNERGHENGRYPAQTYCDDEAAKVLDRQSGISKSTGGDVKIQKISGMYHFLNKEG
jgi:hypothetical protein